jgi:hypothetical protein
MRDETAFHILLDRHERAFREAETSRRDATRHSQEASDLRTKVYQYRELVQHLDKALKAAKVKKRPPLPHWHVDAVKRDEDIPF